MYANLNESSKAIAQPDCTSIELMEHQKRSIYAMSEIERNMIVEAKNVLFFGNESKDFEIETKIGILGDLMGAGKTFMIITLCLLNKSVKSKEMYYSTDKYVGIKRTMQNVINSQTNLIVIPDHLESQWLNSFKLIDSNQNLKVLTYNKNSAKSEFIIDPEVNIVLITSTVFGKFIQEFCNVNWNRIVIDEADNIKIQDCELFANFIWLVTGTPSGIATSKSKYIKNIFGKNINWITDVLTVKNENEYLKKSINLPPIRRFIIECITPPELTILKDFIPQSVVQLINSGNTDEAIKALNCNVDTADNIFVVIRQTILDNIHNKKLEIEIEQKKKLSGTKLEESLAKKNAIENSIRKLESRLKAIQTKIKESNEQICPVCMGDIEGDPVLLNCCGTMFCLTCLIAASKGKHMCLFCMQSVDKNAIHIIKNNVVNKNLDKQKQHKRNKIDELLEIISCAKGGVLVFANFNKTFTKIKNVIDEQLIANNILKGNSIGETLKKFKSGQIKVLMLNASNFGSGLNLEMATDVVIYHRFTKEIEEQVIGRAQRMGRKTNLNVHYLIHSNESTYFSEIFNLEDIEKENCADYMCN